MRTILVIALTLCAATASAEGQKAYFVDLSATDTGCNAVAIDSSKTCTFTPPAGNGDNVNGFNAISIYVDYTNSAATAVVMTCQAQSGSSTTWHAIQMLDATAPPTLTSAPASWSQAVSADEDWVWTVTANYYKLRCSFVGTGADGSDKIIVTARASVI